MSELEGKTICFTGTLSTQTRAQATKTAKAHGAKVTTAVSGNTDILVTGVDGGAKLTQAQSKGVDVWTEEQFNDVIEGTKSTGKKGGKGGGKKVKEEAANTDNILKDKTICFTGTLSTQTRAQATKTAKAHGAKVTTTVSGNTDILVTGVDGGAKLTQAQSKGVDVWTEEQFNDATTTSGKKKKATPEAVGSSAPPKKKGKVVKAVKIEAEKPTPTQVVAKAAASATGYAPATPATPSSSGARKVMTILPNSHQYTVVDEYDVKLMLSDSVNMNSNKFYKLQLLRYTVDDKFYVCTSWGRLSEVGKHQLKGGFDREKSISEFGKIFRSKTKNAWGTNPFVRYDGKYQLIETVGDDTADGSASLGRLTEAQIHKGQGVLQEIRNILESKNKNKPTHILGKLTNDFYSLIPTSSGRQKPPPLNNLDIITEKEGLLEFWLRMGFEELGDGDVQGSPIEGVFDLPVPATLTTAASGITDSGSIKASQTRGKELAKNGAIKMGAELYATILLYTGNAIYQELNRCLRSDWNNVRKYWNYLRLYFESMNAMEGKAVTLYRGIAVDLFDEYTPGKVITWWSVSSCTASKNVAQDFMNQLSGSAATFITLHTKKACDVSSLSFFPHEKESLLRPGTKLKVLNRTRKGKVVEIEVDEVME